MNFAGTTTVFASGGLILLLNVTILKKRRLDVGEASRRGTFKERKEKAVIRNKETAVLALETMERKEAELTQEERSKRTHERIAMLSFMSIAKRSGLSSKEFSVTTRSQYNKTYKRKRA